MARHGWWFALLLTFSASALLPADAAQADPSSHARFAASFPTGYDWSFHETDHFVVAFGGDHSRATHQAHLLELTHARFYRAFSDEAFGLRPLSDRLVAILFDDKNDYLRYARNADRVDMSWTVAYYSARTNRIAFSKAEHPFLDSAAGAPSGTEEAQVHPADNSGSTGGGHSETQVAAQQIAFASATHEAAHQLAFNSGLQRRGVVYPLWVSEGIATNFELSTTAGEFGPHAANHPRHDRLKRAYLHGWLPPLSDFVAMVEVPTDDARAIDIVYAHAWGLFHFLYQQEPEKLAHYLAHLREVPRGRRDAHTVRAEFTRTFGQAEALQQRFDAWIAGDFAAR